MADNIEKMPKSKLLPLNRWEISIAEIMRTNCPSGFSDDDGLMWLDMLEDFAKMLGSEKPRFDQDAFYNHCFSGEPTGTVQESLLRGF